ncbi:MAG: homoserine dehydrogenase [Candidatus Altiarchaeales archaeon IMC4]|nr:MAG: homoserine dehydrogenase [Candidatus Altiarchaeales archaeon IMC4]
MKDVRLTIVGFGAIGRGFAKVLCEKHAFIAKNHGVNLRVSAICEVNGCLVNERGIDIGSALKPKNISLHKDFRDSKTIDVIKNVDADIVLELTPGNIKTGQPGIAHMLAALSSGKHVVTSNKAPLALNFKKLSDAAKDSGRQLKYEATVGGAMPLINLYKKTMQINEINSIYGILNGTCNYVLTKMEKEAVGMGIALAEAQELGYAETDPTYDINGTDTAAKIAILANSLMGADVSFKDISVEGIEDVTQSAIELARKHGHVIKLIGDAKELSVAPLLIPFNHSLNVAGTLNAVMFDTDIAKRITVVGHGAGAQETSSSLFSDVLDIANRINNGTFI